MVNLQEFDTTEISEIERYLQAQVPHTFLQKTYVLTENPVDKANNFITIFRVLESASEYASNDKLREKLKNLLEEVKSIREEIYPLVISYNNLTIETGKNRIVKALISIFSQPEKNYKVDKLVNSFLVFGEKIELNRTEDYIGVDLESDQGKQSMKEIRKTIEAEAI